MAKPFGLGGGPAMSTNAVAGPMQSSPIPMSRPDPSAMMAQAAVPAAMSKQRYDMAMEMLKAAMSGAAASNSPALAFLTPIIGSMVGTKIADKRDAAVSQQQSDMTSGLLGHDLSTKGKAALDVIQNPDAPDFLRQIASSMLKDEVKIGSGGSGGRSRSAPRVNHGPAGAPSATGGKPGPVGRLVGEYDINGVIHGRDRNGVLWPYRTAEGQLAGATPAGRPPNIGQTPAADPQQNADPLGIR